MNESTWLKNFKIFQRVYNKNQNIKSELAPVKKPKVTLHTKSICIYCKAAKKAVSVNDFVQS